MQIPAIIAGCMLNLFDWSLRVSGFDIHKAEAEFGKILQLRGYGLRQWQQQKAWEIFQFHVANNPFYQHFLTESGVAKPDDWSAVPVITKAHMQGNLLDHVSAPYKDKPLFINNTSGSSGVPFFFAKDRWCHALTWASYKHRFGQHGINFNRSLQARFYGIPLSGKKFYKEKVKDWLGHRVRFPVFNLDDYTCATYASRFRKQPFVYLNGYTSSLVLFAQYCRRHQLVLSQLCPTLKLCFTTSEMCSDADRRIMEEGFGVKVVNEYGAAELDLLAVENPDGHWVLNEETVLIEIVDDHGKPVPDGQPGRVVVTALHNRAMPFIRYELGDMGILSTHALPDGRRCLQQLQGRINDIALLPSGRKVPGLTFYYVTKGLLEKGSAVKEFVIRQQAPSRFLLQYVSAEPLSEQDKIDISRLMDEYLEPGLVINFEHVDRINRTTMGKLRQFKSEIQGA